MQRAAIDNGDLTLVCIRLTLLYVLGRENGEPRLHSPDPVVRLGLVLLVRLRLTRVALPHPPQGRCP